MDEEWAGGYKRKSAAQIVFIMVSILESLFAVAWKGLMKSSLGIPAGNSILTMRWFVFSNFGFISASCVRADYKFLWARTPSFEEDVLVNGLIIEKYCSRHLMFVNSTLIRILGTKFLHPKRVCFFISHVQRCHLTSLHTYIYISLKGRWKITRCYSKVKDMFSKIIFAQLLKLWNLFIKWYCAAIVSFMQNLP